MGDLQAAGPLAFAGPFPVLYADGVGLPSTTVGALQSLGIRHALVLGGTLAVPASVEATLSSLGITSERIAGADQMATATDVANFEIAELGFGDSHVDVARGDDFADSLSGGPHAGVEPVPVLLTDGPTVLGSAASAWLTKQCAALTSGNVLGGPMAVSDAVVSAMTTAASCSSTGGGTTGGGGTTPPPPTPGAPTDLVLAPESVYAMVGASTTLTATVTDDGVPVAGARVDFFVVDESTEGSNPNAGVCTLSAAASPANSGAAGCTIDSGDPVTDAAGQATFSFHWASPVGQRPLEGQWPMLVYAFTGSLGTTYDPLSTTQVSNHAHVVWVNSTTSVTLSPAAAVVHYSDPAVVSATLLYTSVEGTTSPVPYPGQTINWSAFRGATCTPGATTPPPGTPTTSGVAYTDANGTATISYEYGSEPIPDTNTVDCLFAFYDANANGALDSGEKATTGTVTWSNEAAVPTTLILSPSGGTALVAPDATQLVTAHVADQYGAPVSGAEVTWSITRNGTFLTDGNASTDGNGDVAIVDSAPIDTSARDQISAAAGPLDASTAAYWVLTAATGSYPSTTILGYQSTSDTTGYIDVSSGGAYLRLYYDANDILKIGSSVVQAERFTESLSPGATLSADPYDADPAAVSTFSVASTGHGGSGHGGGGM